MKKLFVVNLVLIGLILGFVLSVTLFSCSTRVEPAAGVSAQDREATTGRADLQSLQRSFREISAHGAGVADRTDVKTCRAAAASLGASRLTGLRRKPS